MELNLGTEGNDNSKTAFTTNDDKNIDIYIKGEDSKPKKIPFIKPNDSYSYLGILINIDLNWELQEKSLKTNLLKYLILLYNRCFSVKQTVEAINTIFIPALAYRLAVIPIKDKFIKQLDNIIANIVNKKLGIFFKSSKNHLFQESKFGSPNIKSLEIVKIERMLNTIYQIGLNGKDEELRKIIYNYQFKENSLWFDDLKKKGFNFSKQIDNNLERFRLINWLSDDVKNGIHKDLSICNFINILGKLIKYEDLKIKISKYNYEIIKKELVNKDDEIRPLFLYQIGLKEKIKHINSHEIWIDGSYEDNKTSYTTLFDNGNYNNDILPISNKQSNNRGELTAFLIALWMTREVKMIKIYTDSSYVKYIFDRIQENEFNKEINLDIINEIKGIINDRNNKKHIIKVLHINSHLLDENKKIKNKEKKIENMKSKLGKDYKKILEGNKKVDKLAQHAIKKKKYNGYFVNTYGKNWNIVYQKKYYDNIKDIKQLLIDKQEQLHNDKYYQCNIRKLKKEKIDWNANKKIYRSLKFSFHKTQLLNFKILFNKLKTREIVNSNEFIKRGIKDSSKYLTNKCVFCDKIETIEHFLICEKNINKLKNIPRKVVKIINKAGEKFNKKTNINYFPSFYWPGKVFEKYKDRNMKDTKPIIALAGLVPIQLKQELKELEFNNRESDYIILKIMKKLGKTNHKQWIKRCSTLFSS